ncbi:MAG: alpha/beta hydrolase [Polyangiaceae bacterium]
MADAATSGILTTEDGANLAFYDLGGSGPPVLLANGLGGPLRSWQRQIDYLGERYRIISWDYRGLYGSTLAPGDPPRLDVPTHARDLARVAAHLGVERAACIGWSMGVQVLLELYETRPELVSHLVLINGTYGKPLDNVTLPLVSKIVPQLVKNARRLEGVGASLVRRAGDQPETVLWLKRLGLVAATLDDDLFREIAAEFSNVNLSIYMDLLQALGEHDATRMLESVRVPTLVITGDRDRMTPKELALEMARRIPGGELLVVRGASHYAALEYPELVNLRIEKFFREHGVG